MFNGIILYVSCKKVNGKHLSTKTQNTVQRCVNLGLQAAHAHTSAHTPTDKPHYDRKTDDDHRRVCQRVCVDAIMPADVSAQRS